MPGLTAPARRIALFMSDGTAALLTAVARPSSTPRRPGPSGPPAPTPTPTPSSTPADPSTPPPLPRSPTPESDPPLRPDPHPSPSPTPSPTPLRPLPDPTPTPTPSPTPTPTPAPSDPAGHPESDPSPPSPTPTPTPTLAALFVVADPASLGPGDLAVRSRLQTLGYAVTVVDDGASTAADAAGKDVVLISSTSIASKVGTKFRTIAVPVVIWEHALLDDQGMTAQTGRQVNNQTALTINAAGHPPGRRTGVGRSRC